jgi:hypothetical protein
MLSQEKLEVRERIEEKLRIDFLSSFQKDFLSSILWKIQKDWEITEKQQRTLSKILRELDDAVEKGIVWQLTEQEKKEVKTILDLSKGYSDYYLSNHNPPLQRAIRGLLEVQLKTSVGVDIIITEKSHLEAARRIMKSRIQHIENPKFSVGELVFFGKDKSVGVVVEGPSIDKFGGIQYSVDFGGLHSAFQVKFLKKIEKKRRKEQ